MPKWRLGRKNLLTREGKKNKRNKNLTTEDTGGTEKRALGLGSGWVFSIEVVKEQG